MPPGSLGIRDKKNRGLSFGSSNLCDPAGNRTPNRQLRRLMLYPIELPDLNHARPARVAERGGFEPPVRFDPYGGLANRWFQPLTHLSSVDLLTEVSSKSSTRPKLRLSFGS
jgi:hypothetical protein